MKNFKFISICFMIIISSLFLISCGNTVKITTGGLTITFQIPDEILQQSTNYIIDLSKVDVTISKNSTSFNKTIDLSGDLAGASFEDLETGAWNIEVIGKNSAGYGVLSGSATGNVTKSDTTNATVELSTVLGLISAEVIFPAEVNVANGIITLTNPLNEAIQLTKNLDITQNSGTSMIEDVLPTTWNFVVELFDASNNLVAAGEKSIDILPGQTTNLQVTPSAVQAGHLDISLTVHMPPSSPVGVSGTRYNDLVVLSWLPNPEQNIAGYLVYRSLSLTAAKTLLTNQTINVNTFYDNTINNSETYYYWVVAVDTANYYSNLSEPWMAAKISEPIANYQIVYTDYFGNSTCYSTDLNGQGFQWSRVERSDLLSKDRTQLARVTENDWDVTIMMMNIDGTNRREFTKPNLPSQYVAWSDDCSKFVLTNGGGTIYSLNADGTNVKEVYNLEEELSWIDLSSDGQSIFYVGNDYITRRLYKIDANGENQVTLAKAKSLFWPSISPDGTEIVYITSSDSENYTLNLINVDGTNHRVVYTSDFTSMPVWSPDGSRIAFGDKSNNLTCLRVMDRDGSNFESYYTNVSYIQWTPDSSHIIFNSKTMEESTITGMDLYIKKDDGSYFRQITFTDNIFEWVITVLPL
ncbi:MAG: DUF5050 domain-containing protein [Halanaerobiales bacterium]|nr:DUF5050 domain-containing protein [Halanaerobiales bacterium]